MPKPLSNHEIVTLAVYLLGGDSQHIDTEDVAIKANEIAPGRFSWRKYPDQISIANVSKRLWDAMNSEKGGYLIGSERKGWLVTESGLRFAKERMADLDGATQPRKTLGLKEKQWQRSERARLLDSDALLRIQRDGLEAVTLQEAEAFFRLDDYVTGEAREQKIIRVLNAFGDDPELGQAAQDLARKVRGDRANAIR